MSQKLQDVLLIATVSKPYVSIVLPTFNEAANIPELLKQISVVMTEANLSFECIFVDDSIDDTADVIVQTAKLYQGYVSVVKRTGDAARTGLTKAFQRGFVEARGEIIVCMDTDLQHPPASIPELVAVAEGSRADVAVASRYVYGGSAEGLDGFWRHLVSRLTTVFVHMCLPGTRATTDPMTGYFAFKSSLLHKVTFSSFGFKILVELLSSLSQPRVVDIPFTFQKRTSEVSKASLRQGLLAYKDILSLFVTGDRGSYTLRTFVVASGVAIVSLLGIGLMVLNEKLGLAFFAASSVSVGVNSSAEIYQATYGLLAIIITIGSIIIFCWSLPRETHRIYSIESILLTLLHSILVVLVYWYAILQLGVTGVYGATAVLLTSFMGVYLVGRSLWNKEYTRFFAPERWFVLLIVTFGVSLISYFAETLLWWEGVLLGLYVLVISQGIFALYLMVYAWERGDYDGLSTENTPATKPYYSFTAIIPCKHEKDTIADTLRGMFKIKYPEDKKEVLVVIHKDSDDGTIAVVRDTIAELKTENIKLVTYNQEPVNKPHGLNRALAEASGDFVAIFDAEDEIHPDLFSVINAELLRGEADVVQSGVQLMNYDSNWYSTFNVLEYYFWFKSSLHFYAKHGVVPLGGVSVFFRRTLLERVGGWDINCLTEDAEVGMRLSRIGAKISVVYNPAYSTQEETPPTVMSFIKQRTRWAQGFLQILARGTFWHFPTWRQRLLGLYILAWPILLPVLFLLMPLGIFLILFTSLAPMIAVIANVSLILFLMFVVVQIFGFYEFTKEYQRKFSWWRAVMMVFLFYPYTVLLMIASFRAVYRQLAHQHGWEKTEHRNTHRQAAGFGLVSDLSRSAVTSQK